MCIRDRYCIGRGFELTHVLFAFLVRLIRRHPCFLSSTFIVLISWITSRPITRMGSLITSYSATRLRVILLVLFQSFVVVIFLLVRRLILFSHQVLLHCMLLLSLIHI